jgi:hypothetical protein
MLLTSIFYNGIGKSKPPKLLTDDKKGKVLKTPG